MPAGATGTKNPAVPSTSSGRSKSNIAVDRAALGLSSLKPSEMIQGLDKVAARAEKLEAREEAKRKSGGRAADAAMLTDDTGRRWSRNVNLAIFGTVLLIGAAGAAMFWWSNRQPIDHRKHRAETQETMTKLLALGSRVKPFEEGDTISPEKAREAFLKLIESDLKTLNDEIARDKAKRAKDAKFRPPDRMMSADLNALNKLLELKDGWGQPLVFSMADADSIKISATGKAVAGLEPVDPVVLRLRAGKGASPEKTDKPKDEKPKEKADK